MALYIKLIDIKENPFGQTVVYMNMFKCLLSVMAIFFMVMIQPWQNLQPTPKVSKYGLNLERKRIKNIQGKKLAIH